ncbi:MBL fold metallo-hydrolase [Psychrobacillus sp. OK032]|uniref:MBL fold metallo-hydrolase n=1 Tax=Psychrobacillus sp. OK032 TaxID=1884358 RepID=UPI0008B2369F|nr:MBL fold metallo-hydrolase [Psychrobacillus sp. OK032]SER81141.1 Glyoxylase, beta-lactamase superfamily II [Psychrobacillus sp. OK032]
MLNARTYPLGYIQTNCYIISNAEKECLIFDPGGEGEKIISELRKLNLKPLAILLTHAHFDHIGAVDDVRDTFRIPVYIHTSEKKWLLDPSKNGSAKYAEIPSIVCKEADIILENDSNLKIGSFAMQLLHTPGHSPGSITYYFAEAGFAIVGDTLFQNSIGRTDLPSGNQAELMKSIHTKLLTLPESTIIYPGHGSATTIEDEMESNPFLNGF